MLHLPVVSKMTTPVADEFVHTYLSHFDVDEHELRGGTHFYFTDDGYILKINKRKVVIVDENDIGETYAIFTE
jgi:hypothetical protein